MALSTTGLEDKIGNHVHTTISAIDKQKIINPVVVLYLFTVCYFRKIDIQLSFKKDKNQTCVITNRHIKKNRPLSIE